MFFISICVLLIITLLIAFKKTRLIFKLMNYDYTTDDSKSFYGSDEMLEAYNKYLEEAKLN